MRKLLAPAVVALVLLAPSVAHAAPQYVSSDPEHGAELHEAPAQVRITFSEPLDASSKLVILDECDRRIDGNDNEVFANEMTVSVAKTPSGHYRAIYVAVGLGGVTGTTKGAVEFHVHAGSPCGDQVSTHHDHESGNKDKDHKNHDGNHKQDNHGDHGDDGEHSSSDHTTSGHTTHTSTMSDHSGHEAAADQNHQNHKKNPPQSSRRTNSRGPAIAGSSDLVPSPDDGAVLLALGLSTLVGALGGVFLRLSARRI